MNPTKEGVHKIALEQNKERKFWLEEMGFQVGYDYSNRKKDNYIQFYINRNDFQTIHYGYIGDLSALMNEYDNFNQNQWEANLIKNLLNK